MMGATDNSRHLALAPIALGVAMADGAHAKATLPPVQPVDTLPERAAGTPVERGKAELRAGRPADAVAAFREALAADPRSVDALSGMAVAYDQLGRYDLSRPLYEAALILDPRAPVLLYNYGLSLSRQRDRAGALRFLGLAAASGDAEVVTAALRLIAALDPQGLAARPDTSAAPTAVAVVAEPPALSAAVPADRPSGPALVRTSEHEVRLVLKPERIAPPPLLAELGPDALAALPVTGLSTREEAIIQARADAIEAAERRAQAHAEAAARDQAALAALPSGLRDTLAAAAAVARAPRPVLPDTLTGPANAPSAPRSGPATPAPVEATLDATAQPRDADRHLEAGQLVVLALAQPALQAQRRSPLSRAAELLPPAEPQPRTRRAFDAPFESDDARLNGFARQVQGAEPGAAMAVARLRTLLDRLQAA